MPASTGHLPTFGRNQSVQPPPALKPAAGIAGVMQVPEARFKVQVTLPALPLHVDVPVFQDELSSLLMMLLASWLA